MKLVFGTGSLYPLHLTTQPVLPNLDAVERLKAWARRLRRDAIALWFATRHPEVPWGAKALGLIVVAYALSPIDLIPDFIPVLGLLDELILLPGLIWLAIRLIPALLFETCRAQADVWWATQQAKPVSRIGLLLVLSIWIAIGYALWRWTTQP